MATTFNADSTMAWHVRQRMLWIGGRLALGAGEPDRATAAAAMLIADASERGSRRYLVLGQHLAAVASPRATPHGQVDAILDGLDSVAGVDAWWLTDELATATGIGPHVAAARAKRLLDSAGPDVDRVAMARWLDRHLDGRRDGRRSRSRSAQ